MRRSRSRWPVALIVAGVLATPLGGCAGLRVGSTTTDRGPEETVQAVDTPDPGDVDPEAPSELVRAINACALMPLDNADQMPPMLLQGIVGFAYSGVDRYTAVLTADQSPDQLPECLGPLSQGARDLLTFTQGPFETQRLVDAWHAVRAEGVAAPLADMRLDTDSGGITVRLDSTVSDEQMASIEAVDPEVVIVTRETGSP